MIVLGGTVLLLLLRRVNFGTPLGIDIAALVLLTLHVKGAKQVPFSLSSCFLLFSLLITELVSFGLYVGTMPYMPMISFLMLVDLIVILIWQTGHIKIYALGTSVTVITGSLILIGYRLLSRRFIYEYYEAANRYSLTALEKTGIILLAAICYFLICTAVLRLLFFLAKKLWGSLFKRLSERLHGSWRRQRQNIFPTGSGKASSSQNTDIQGENWTDLRSLRRGIPHRIRIR